MITDHKEYTPIDRKGGPFASLAVELSFGFKLFGLYTDPGCTLVHGKPQMFYLQLIGADSG